jgi:transcriptional regulator with XRE-family HTH domain
MGVCYLEIPMEIKEAFAGALKHARKTRGLTQEAFSDVSSRTYISTLERGIKSPTIEKVDVLAKTLGIHPLTLLTLTYMAYSEESNPSKLINLIGKELNQLSS